MSKLFIVTGETILNVFASSVAWISNLVHSFHPSSRSTLLRVYVGHALTAHLYVFACATDQVKYHVLGTVNTRATNNVLYSAICHTLPVHAQVAHAATIYLSPFAGVIGGADIVIYLTFVSVCEVITPYVLKYELSNV